MDRERPLRIGYLFDEFYEDYIVHAWRGAAEAATGLGASLLAFGGGCIRNPRGEHWLRNDIFALVRPSQLDGLVVLTASLANFIGSGPMLEFCSHFGDLPIVHVGVEDPALPSVRVDGYSGMRELVDHLVERHGKRRIAFIRGPADVLDADERYQAYKDSLAAHGIPYDEAIVVQGDFYRESGALAVEILLDMRGARFDALVGANDYMAIFAMKELQRRGISVPGDVAVAGFDDLHAAKCASPALTSVYQPIGEMSAEAVRMLAGWIARGKAPGRALFKSSMVVRRSCGCLPEASRGGAAGIAFAEQEELGRRAVDLVGRGDGQAFLRWLDGAVEEGSRKGVHAGEWIPAIARALERAGSGGGAAGTAIVDVLGPTVYRYVTLLQEERAARDFMAKEEEEIVLQQLAGSLVGKLDREQVRENLGRVLVWAGIGFFCGVAYTGPERGEVFQCTDKGLEGRSFDVDEILPGGLAARPGGESLVFIPLHYGGESLGYFACEAVVGKERLIELLREHLSGALYNSRLRERDRELTASLERKVEERTRELGKAMEELRKANARLEEISTVDELTGTLNRRGFMAAARRQVDLAARKKRDFLLLFLDLDGLKAINDGYGHSEGDWAIRAIASILQQSFRQTDVVGRFGGDEFVVLAIDCTMAELDLVIGRLESLAAELNSGSGKPFKVAYCIGAAPANPGASASLEALMAEADSRLCEAKRSRPPK